METGESSETAAIITTIIKEDGKIKLPRREAPTGKKEKETPNGTFQKIMY